MKALAAARAACRHAVRADPLDMRDDLVDDRVLHGGQPAARRVEIGDIGQPVQPADRLAQLAGAGGAEHRLDQRIELCGEALALLGDVGGRDAGIVARARPAGRRPARGRARLSVCGQRPGNRSRPARAAAPAPGRARSRRCRRRGSAVSTPASAIATVWRRLNLLCSPSTGAGMLQTRSQPRSSRKVTPAICLGGQPVLARAAGGRIRSARASCSRRRGI